MLGPLLFTAFVSPIGLVFDSFEVGYHSYADDAQLYAALRSTPASNFDRLSNCTAALQHWFWRNDLLLNPDKSEAAFFGTKPGLRKPGLPSSISAVVRAYNYHLRLLRYIRHSFTRNIANTLACSIAGSRIDYCNALLYGVSGKNIDRLQRLQNGLARVVCDIGVRKLHDSGLNSMALLKELHWLPIRTRIEFKVMTLCYKAYRLGTPSYLGSSLQPYLLSRMLRSSNQDQLTVPASRIKLTSRRFSACALLCGTNSRRRCVLLRL